MVSGVGWSYLINMQHIVCFYLISTAILIALLLLPCLHLFTVVTMLPLIQTELEKTGYKHFTNGAPKSIN